MAFPSAALTRLHNDEDEGKEEEEQEESVDKGYETVELLKLDNQQQQLRRSSEIEIDGVEEDDGSSTRLRYVPLCDVYSATSPCVSSASGGSKKVKPPRKLLNHFDGHDPADKSAHQFLIAREGVRDCDFSDNFTVNAAGDGKRKPPITKFYTRRDKGKQKEREDGRQNSRSKGVIFGTFKGKEEKDEGVESENGESTAKKGKRRRLGGYELASLGVDPIALSNLDRLQFRKSRHGNDVNISSSNRNSIVGGTNHNLNYGKMRKRKTKGDMEEEVRDSGALRTKRWIWLSFDGTDPDKLVGLQCKVFWPLDADWYKGRIVAYDLESGRHSVEYEDGDEEKLILLNERIKFHISPEEMQNLKLRASDKCLEGDSVDVNEMVALAATLDECAELEPEDIIWAKLTGHAMWPALVLDNSLVGEYKGLNRNSGEKSVLVQFFGTHDFARIKRKQVISFLRGLLSSFHLKCKKPNFVQSLEEAKMYLSEQKLPKRMVQLRNGFTANHSKVESREDEGCDDVGKEGMGDEEIQRRIEAVRSFPFEVGDLQIITLGKVVRDSENFQDGKVIWPEGYTALRRFPSIADPNVHTTYKMEVLRDDGLRTRPLFRVTSENGEQFDGSSPSACWNKIYRRMRKIQLEGLQTGISEMFYESGSDMFGFSHPEISKLIQELSTSTSRMPLKSSKIARARYQDLPVGYRAVDVKWNDLDKCNVCHMDEEYENNLFLQCEKCRIMVHARCYGEREPVGGVLWLCNLCRPGAPERPPACCLCPVIGGAMKPTTDGRWAHLACAIWIPETCLSDITKMEPIDGLSRINKDRWKLLCSICGVAYGACIQCSNNTCRVAYHPLCARAAGFCVELEDEDRLNLIPLDQEDDDQCIRLLSFCKRHSPLSSEHLATEDRIPQKAFKFSEYSPQSNPSGCARTEPYNYFGRRGRKEPEALAAASLKRLYVENRPHLVGGFSQHESFQSDVSSGSVGGSRFSIDLLNLKASQLDASRSILSMTEKYTHMKETLRKRLAFGKSGIHGFGIFAKHPHRAGDMVIEYTGELVRPSIADRREHLIYNSLVGAGTYMFRIDDERVIDATRAGSIAHLINHSCEPNCYSRVISINGDEHIIIFAKRDIKQWEELTYDYRFFALDEQLACYCGFPRCRGVVNDTEAEERAAKLYAPCGELVDWKGE